MPEKYIVTNGDGLLVRSQMTTTNPFNVKRKMSNGEGFTVYQVYVQNGSHTWGRVTDNPGSVQQQYVCLSIVGRPPFAVLEAPISEPTPAPSDLVTVVKALGAWASLKGYEGPQL